MSFEVQFKRIFKPKSKHPHWLQIRMPHIEARALLAELHACVDLEPTEGRLYIGLKKELEHLAYMAGQRHDKTVN